MFLDIESRIGHLALKEKPLTPKGGKGKFKPSGKPRKPERLGMTPKKLEAAQTIAKNPEIVEIDPTFISGPWG